MNFSIHIDDLAAKQLALLAKKSGKTRNALINQAVHMLINQQSKNEWPKAVLTLAGADKSLAPFENQRRELKPPSEDPLE